MEWSADGQLLAVLQAGSASVLLWELSTMRSRRLDLGGKELTFLSWSPTGVLAVGSAKGSLLLWDSATGQQTVAASRHKRRVTCGCWSVGGELAFASEDRQITICSGSGETVDQVKLKCRPLQVAFGGAAAMQSKATAAPASGAAGGRGSGAAEAAAASFASTAADGRLDGSDDGGDSEHALRDGSGSGSGSDSSSSDSGSRSGSGSGSEREGDSSSSSSGSSGSSSRVISVNMDGKTILLYNLNERENALELAFQPRYGAIVSYQWFGAGQIMVAFSSGYLVVISTHMDEIGREQFCSKLHKDSLRDVVFHARSQRVATCGDKVVKIVDMADWREVSSHTLDKDAGPLDRLHWTADGCLLSVSTRSGCLYNFVMNGSTALADDDSQLRLPPSVVSAVWRPVAPLKLVGLLLLLAGLILLALAALCQQPVVDVLEALLGIVEAV
eukprot:PLAT4961.1.p1 GENE.PLAT4961.1~~PLAT4961.1.p1  ORF type:complete len:517 (-),score=173.66 PLAT4961.1:54-1385(-)